MATTTQQVTIAPINNQILEFTVRGTSPYLQARFSAKAMQAMSDKMEAGSTAKKGKKREARDFNADFLDAQHISTDGWNGIPCAAFRNAMIRACSSVGFKMTEAKMSVFVESDGFDRVDGMPLVRLRANRPEMLKMVAVSDADDAPPEKTKMAVRNATGVVDIRVRPMWRTWWAIVRVRYDADQFTATDISNLLERAGQQVGIGEGRPASKMSNGMGFGLFTIRDERQEAA